MDINNIVAAIERHIDTIYKENRFDQSMVEELNGYILDIARSSLLNNYRNDTLNRILKNLLEYLKQSDIVGIRDVLEFELLEFIRKLA